MGLRFKCDRAISLTIAILFTFQTIAWSAPVQPSTVSFQPSVERLDHLSLVNSIQIPAELGTIEKTFDATEGFLLTAKSPTIIHIQDAHGSYEAQKNIAGIIEHLVDQYGVERLFLEAANEKLDPSRFHFFKKHSLNLEVADLLMRHGELTGAEMFLLKRSRQEEGTRPSGYGVEDTTTYRQDLALFQEVIREKEGSKSFIQHLSSQMKTIESRVFSPTLLQFVKAWRSYRQTPSELRRFLRLLYSIANEKLAINLQDPNHQDTYGNVIRIIKLDAVEARLDQQDLKREHVALSDLLSGHIDDKLYSWFTSLLSSEKGEHEGYPRFQFERIYDQIASSDIDFKDFPQFLIFAQSLIFQAEVDALALFQEVENLTNEVLRVLAKSDKEKELIRFAQNLDQLKNLLVLELSRNEYSAFEKQQDHLSPKHLLSRIHELTGEEGNFQDTAEIQERFQKALAFYSLAEEREAYFIDKTLFFMSKEKNPISILVTGGFHTHGLQDLLQERGVSYISIRPRMGETANIREIYVRAMLGKTQLFETSEIGNPSRQISQEARLSLLPESMLIKNGVGLDMPELELLAAKLVLEAQRLSPKETNRIYSLLLQGDRNVRVTLRDFSDASDVQAQSLGSDDEIDYDALLDEKPFWTRRSFLFLGILGISGGGFLLKWLVGANGATDGNGDEDADSKNGNGKEYSASVGDYRFAHSYTQEDLLKNPAKAREYVQKLLYWEGKFHQSGIGYNGESGLTYDGHSIDFDTGELTGGPRNWSAASKESLHVALLTKAISGDANANLFISPEDPSKAEAIAIDILTRKISSYEKFNRTYRGFGGFLPWFLVSNDGMVPTHDWQDRVPALDNGQLAWSLYIAYHILNKKGYANLSARYKSHFNLMAANAVKIFHEGDGKIRGVANIKNTRVQPSAGNYSTSSPKYYLLSPYEAEAMVFFMTLFSRLSNSEVDEIWKLKRAYLEPVIYQTPKGEITIQKGHWLSSHEQWKYLILPYRDIPLAREIFVNTEIARTWYSAQNKIPGLFASVHGVVTYNSAPPYIGALGIQKLAREQVSRSDIVTPYAAFSVILAEIVKKGMLAGPPAIGLAWLNTMLKGPKMQSRYGSPDSVHIKGNAMAPVLTWDAKVTTVLAVVGGIYQEIAEALKQDGKYQRFYQIVEREHRLAFPDVKGEGIPFAAPTATIPLAMPDFKPAVKVVQPVEVLKGTAFQGGGDLLRRHRFTVGGALELPASRGYLWNRILRVNLEEAAVINITFRTRAQGIIGIEVKNILDQRVTGGKTVVLLPNTKGKEETISFKLTDQGIVRANKIAGFFVFSDPQIHVTISSVTFTEKPVQGAIEFTYNGILFRKGRSLGSAEDDLKSFNLIEEGVKLEDRQQSQKASSLGVEQTSGAIIAEKLRTVLDAGGNADMQKRFLEGGYEQDGYGVPVGAAIDGSHAYEGSQGYFAKWTLLGWQWLSRLGLVKENGRDTFLETVGAMKDFFKRRENRIGKPIRLVIKPGIGGQHTPFQGIADMFSVIDTTTGLVVGEYELGKNYEAAISEILTKNGWDWDQVAVIPSSKSGSTDETMMVFGEVLHVLLKQISMKQGFDESQGEAFANVVFSTLHDVNFIKDADGKEKERPGKDLFKVDKKRFGTTSLLELVQRNATTHGLTMDYAKVKQIFGFVLGNMFFETTDDPEKSRLSAFIRNSGLDQELDVADKPGFGAMYHNVGGRWTGDLHMMTFLAFHDLDPIAYWNTRNKGIRQVRKGKHAGNELGHQILDEGIKDITLVLPDEAFWFGKSIEQNFNESIWQEGFSNLITIKQSKWEKQKHHYEGKKDRLVINLTDLTFDDSVNVFQSTPIRLAGLNKQELANQMGELLTLFYGMTNTVGTRLIARALQKAGHLAESVNLNDLDNPATKIVQQNLFLLQPYVELSKGLLKKRLDALQAAEAEKAGTIKEEEHRILQEAARGQFTTNIPDFKKLEGITDAETLKTAILQAMSYAKETNRKFVPFIYLEGDKFYDLRDILIDLGVEWVMQGTGDQHISYQQVLAQPQKFLPFIISFVPERFKFARPAIGFAKGYLDQVSPYMVRDFFAEASYEALTSLREDEGGAGLFLRVIDADANLTMLRDGFQVSRKAFQKEEEAHPQKNENEGIKLGDLAKEIDRQVLQEIRRGRDGPSLISVLQGSDPSTFRALVNGAFVATIPREESRGLGKQVIQFIESKRPELMCWSPVPCITHSTPRSIRISLRS